MLDELADFSVLSQLQHTATETLTTTITVSVPRSHKSSRFDFTIEDQCLVPYVSDKARVESYGTYGQHLSVFELMPEMSYECKQV
ncbi:unnamed protein product [Orchesella dallaii]|uniref:Uncharacterized protein n=1 Tax=Orchesella dallaii TaxID=48710 RepID=A0ABP1QHV6_9HEXA